MIASVLVTLGGVGATVGIESIRRKAKRRKLLRRQARLWFGQRKKGDPDLGTPTSQVLYDVRDWGNSNASAIQSGRSVPVSDSALPISVGNDYIDRDYFTDEVANALVGILEDASEVQKQLSGLTVNSSTVQVIEDLLLDIADQASDLIRDTSRKMFKYLDDD